MVKPAKIHRDIYRTRFIESIREGIRICLAGERLNIKQTKRENKTLLTSNPCIILYDIPPSVKVKKS